MCQFDHYQNFQLANMAVDICPSSQSEIHPLEWPDDTRSMCCLWESHHSFHQELPDVKVFKDMPINTQKEQPSLLSDFWDPQGMG